MKKSDLKSGMVVKFREYDDKYILIDDVFCSYDGLGFIRLSKFDDNLHYMFDDEEVWDIMEVYKCKWPNIMSCFMDGKLELIWEREKDNNSIYEDYRQAVEYDKDLCTTIAMEECAELIQAISKAKRGKLDRDNLVEEIADVLVCIEWLQEIYDISTTDISEWFIKKTDRVVDRLNTGEFK